MTLLERYPYLGGLASGGMVLVLDDMSNGPEITVQGMCQEIVDRMAGMVSPSIRRAEDRARTPPCGANGRAGACTISTPIEAAADHYAAAFDPDGWKRVSKDLVAENKIDLRLHSWFSRAIVEDGRIRGVVCETKAGRQAIMGDVVIDATGDLDVAASAGAPFTHGSYILTTVFRLGGVDTDAAECFQYGEPESFSALDREAKRIIGGAWEMWWLKTPLPGVVWCNCPHMTGFDGIKVEDLTKAEAEGRGRIYKLVDWLRKTPLPGFERCTVSESAIGITTLALPSRSVTISGLMYSASGK